MPTYEYRCSACRHAWERFQSIKVDPERTCPKCGKATAQRQVGIGIGILTGGRGSEPAEATATAATPAATSPTTNAGATAKPATTDAAATPAVAPKETTAPDTGKVNATHPAREGRGAGNLRDAIRRQRKTGSKTGSKTSSRTRRGK